RRGGRARPRRARAAVRCDSTGGSAPAHGRDDGGADQVRLERTAGDGDLVRQRDRGRLHRSGGRGCRRRHARRPSLALPHTARRRRYACPRADRVVPRGGLRFRGELPPEGLARVDRPRGRARRPAPGARGRPADERGASGCTARSAPAGTRRASRRTCDGARPCVQAGHRRRARVAGRADHRTASPRRGVRNRPRSRRADASRGAERRLSPCRARGEPRGVALRSGRRRPRHALGRLPRGSEASRRHGTTPAVRRRAADARQARVRALRRHRHVIILDSALERRGREGNPVRVGLIGAGAIGGAIAQQLLSPVVGIELAAIAGRNRARVKEIVGGSHVLVSDDPLLVCSAPDVDVIIEATGDAEAGAHVTLEAIEHGKHVVLVNAELAATLGPILRVRAEQKGLVVSYTDGDEPGILMNLYRYATTIGCRPVLAGNVKGLLDPYRTPETQQDFAAQWGQKPRMVTSFADGTKLSMEMALVANATGFGVARRGMMGHRVAHVKDVPTLYDGDALLERGLVDFVLGAEPGSGGFLVVHDDEPSRREWMRYFKLGDGPFYVFYQPWHLPHLEAPLTAARAVLFHDA